MAKRFCITLNQYIPSKQCGAERNVKIECDQQCEFHIVAKEIDQQRTNMTEVNKIDSMMFNNPMETMAEIVALTSAMQSKRKRSRRNIVEEKPEEKEL